MEIKIYMLPTCSWCEKLKKWLKAKKLGYEMIDVAESQNDEYRDEMIEKSSQMAVPVIDIDGEIIVGFDEKKLQKAVDKAQEKEK